MRTLKKRYSIHLRAIQN